MLNALKVFGSIVLLAAAIYLLDVNIMIDTLKGGSGLSFAIAIVINLATFIVMGVRWYLLIHTQSERSFVSHTAIYMKATFLNTFTPANIGGDAYRFAALKNDARSANSLIKLLLRERILGFYGYMAVFLISFLFVFPSTDFDIPLARNLYLYGALLALATFILPFFVRGLESALSSFFSNKVYVDKFRKIEYLLKVLSGLFTFKGTALLMLITIGSIFLWIISIKIIAEGFGLSVGLIHLAIVATLVEIIRLVPISIQGIGLREGMFSYLMSLLGYGAEQSYIIAVIAYLALSISIVLSGPIGQGLNLRSNEKKSNASLEGE